MSGLIWIQTVCKGYQQTTLGKELEGEWGNSVFSLSADEGIEYKIEELWMLIDYN